MGSGDWIAITAVLASMVVAIYSVWQTRQAAREERQQGRLADTYVTLTDYALRTAQYARTALPGIDDDHELRDPPLGEGEWLLLRARVSAYGSDSVRAGFEALLEHRVRTATALDAWRSALSSVAQRNREEREAGLGDRDALRVSREALAKSADQIVELVRRELR